jgi:hypothetical protein
MQGKVKFEWTVKRIIEESEVRNINIE